MYSILSTPLMVASSGWATVDSTTAAEAPGKRVLTWTWGGTMSGNWATGRRVQAIRPARVVMMAMTTARRGRSTKMAESMGSAGLFNADNLIA